MSLDIDRINGLLSIVKEAAQHPTQLASLGTLAMKELKDHNAEAKKEHDTFLAEQAKEAVEKKADANLKAKKLADEELKKAELTKPDPEAKQKAVAEEARLRDESAKIKAKKPGDPVAKPADEFEEQTETETVRRREVPEEVNHGA